MKIKQDLYVILSPEYSKTLKKLDKEKGSSYGKITMGDDYKYFYMSPQIWTIKQYQEQWKLALERIKTHNQSAFMQNIDAKNKTLLMWGMYKNKTTKTIEFINLIFTDEEYNHIMNSIKITPENSFNIIPSREEIQQGEDEYFNSLDPNNPQDKAMLEGKGKEEKWILDYED